jgi:1-phosphofructokinase
LAGFLSRVITAEAAAKGRETGTRPEMDVRGALTTAASWGALAVSLPTTLINSFDKAPIAQLREIDEAHLLSEIALVRY